MHDESELRRALAELGRTGVDEPIDEEQVRTLFRRQQRHAWSRWLSVAAALCLALAVSWFVSRHRRVEATPAGRTNPFVLLPYGQSDVPLESGVVVRVRLHAASGPIEAEVMIGQDGMARAVRITE